MKRLISSLLFLALGGIVISEEIKIDFARAKELFTKQQSGGTLTSEERQYLEEAKRQHEARASSRPGPAAQAPSAGSFDWSRARQIYEKRQRGESLTAEEQALLDEAMKRRSQRSGGEGRPAELPPGTKPAEAALGLVPLSELTGSYHGWDGGLYGAGKNVPPAAHQQLADKACAEIRGLDFQGKPAAEGKIVLLSLGMSNTTQEFSRFLPLANGDARKNAQLIIVDGAQGGQTAQVQVLWMKQANAGPSQGRESEKQRLQDDVQQVVLNARQKFPNVKLAFLSSRIYAGYAQTPLNPEPYAYEGAFAMRGLIQKQMNGDAALNADPAKGEVKAPVLLWGPYLWAAGATPRKGDGLTYLPEDFAGDGTHPSQSGAAKVAKLLLDFFTTDANAKPWFMKK